MKSKIIAVIMNCIVSSLFGQSGQKNHFPIATFHQSNAKINGISFGLLAEMQEKHENTVTNGLRLEFPGLGLLLPLAPRSPINEGDKLIKNSEIKFVEKINGLNLSASGTVCSDCLVNGISLGGIGNYVHGSNGIIFSLMGNIVENQNGLELAMFNLSHKMNGVQVGVGNEAFDSKGVQIGILSNHSKKARGLQIALFNKSNDFRGLQLGLWNVNQKRKLPLMNWNFKR